MQDLTVSFLQQPLVWQDPVANRTHFDSLFDSAPDSDLVLLPEMFTTGFSMDSERLAESMDGDSVQWMREKAAALNAVIAGSLIIRDNGHCFNRLIWMPPGGECLSYDKRHLFRMANEQDYYKAGEERLIASIKGWRVAPMICYDLRFPVWVRNSNCYDLLVLVANWPAVRRGHWCTLLPARAIENLAYTIGVNRIGSDGNGIEYAGDSVAIDPTGEILNDAGSDAAVQTVTLSASLLQEYRARFPAHLDADVFELQ